MSMLDVASLVDAEPPAEDVAKEDAFAAWRVPCLSSAEFEALGTGEALSARQLAYLASFGLLAPTSHNTVPQRFAIDEAGGSLIVLLERRRVLPQSDPVGRQATVSLGCAIEAIALAARVFSRRVDVEWLAADPKSFHPATVDGASLTTVARLRFVRDTSQALDPHWLELIRARKSLRAEYDRSVSLPAELAEKLRETVAKQFGDTDLHLIQKKTALVMLGKFQEQADRFVLENRPFAEELGAWLIPNADGTATVGMRGREFGFDDEFSKHIHLGLLGHERLLPDQVAAFAKGGRLGIESSSAAAVLTVADDCPLARVVAGRAFLHCALLLWDHGYYTAMHAGITEVSWVTSIFATTVLRTLRRPTVVFRIGQPRRGEDRKRLKSSRPRLEEILVDLRGLAERSPP